MDAIKRQYPASLAPGMPDDPRQAQWAREREENGFDNTELWNLDSTFAALMLPRLRAYLVYTDDKVVRDDLWHSDMARIIAMMELLNRNEDKVYTDEENAVIAAGLAAFCDNICRMWY